MQEVTNGVSIINNPGPTAGQEQIKMSMEISKNLLKRDLSKQYEEAQKLNRVLYEENQVARIEYDKLAQPHIKEMVRQDPELVVLFHQICGILERMDMDVPEDTKDIISEIRTTISSKDWIDDGVMKAYADIEMHLFGEKVTMIIYFDQTPEIMAAYAKYMDAIDADTEANKVTRDLRDRLNTVEDVCEDLKTDLLVGQLRRTEGGQEILENANTILNNYMKTGERKTISLLEG